MIAESTVLPAWRLGRVIAVSSVVGVLTAILVGLSGYQPIDADIKYDWLSAWGAVHDDAHKDVIELADRVGVEIGVTVPIDAEPPYPHPRLPGAVVSSFPLLALPWTSLFAVSAGLVAAATCAYVLLTASPRGASETVAFLAVTALSAPFFTTVRYAGQASVVALFTYVALRLAHEKSERLGGLALAVAATLKVFPATLGLMWLGAKKWQAAAWAFIGFAVFNLLPLMLDGITLSGTVAAMSSAERWMFLWSNASLASLLGEVGFDYGVSVAIGLGVGVLMIVASWSRKQDALFRDPLPWLIVGLLVIPISWVSYDLIVLPAALVLLRAARRSSRLASYFILMLWVLPLLMTPFVEVRFGLFGLVARLLLFLVWWQGRLEWSESGAWTPSDGRVAIHGRPSMNRSWAT